MDLLALAAGRSVGLLLLHLPDHAGELLLRLGLPPCRSPCFQGFRVPTRRDVQPELSWSRLELGIGQLVQAVDIGIEKTADVMTKAINERV